MNAYAIIIRENIGVNLLLRYKLSKKHIILKVTNSLRIHDVAKWHFNFVGDFMLQIMIIVNEKVIDK